MNMNEQNGAAQKGDDLRINVLNQNGTIHLELDAIPLEHLKDAYFGIDPVLETITLSLDKYDGVETGEQAGNRVRKYMYDLILVRGHESIKKVRAKRYDDVVDAFRTLVG